MQTIIKLIIILTMLLSANIKAQSIQEGEINYIIDKLISNLNDEKVKHIVVANFKCKEDSTKQLCEFLSEEFSSALSNTNNNFNVVDRSRLNLLLEETQLAKDDLLDPNTIIKMGNIKGIDTIVYGSLISRSNSKWRLFVKVINIETAKILTSVKGDISKNKKYSFNFLSY